MTRVRLAIAGCGSVSRPYLTDLSASPFAEVVAVCDAVPARAASRAAEFGVPGSFGSLPEMLAGADFELLVNLTAMPAHYELNLMALQAGKHVLSEKPFAASMADARRLLAAAAEAGVRLWAAPTVVISPAFRCMAEVLASGQVGRVYAARAWYGHTGPGWGPWFYRKGGGALFDLAVYNITTLTGLLGPARAVTALTGIAVPERIVEGEPVRVEAEDNAALLMDHGDTVFSCVQTGFVYGGHPEDRTVELVGTRGSVSLLGWDWQPSGVEVWRDDDGSRNVLCTDQQGYRWECGASYLAECLATGREPLLSIEHALHVLEVMLAASESAASGRRVDVTSRFRWPLFGQPVAGDQTASPRGLDPDTHRR